MLHALFFLYYYFFLNFKACLCYFIHRDQQRMTKSNKTSEPIMYLEMLYNQHGPAILRYLHRLVGPKMAEDVLQDTFVQAAIHIDRLNSVVSPKAWLFKVAKNMAFNHLRKKRVRTDILWSSLIQSSPQEDSRLEPMRRAIQTLPSDTSLWQESANFVGE